MSKDADWLRTLYIGILRVERDNPWIKLKKEDIGLFDELAKILTIKHMDYLDYIQFHFKYMKGYPSVKYICSVQALQRYEIHQKMKNKYIMNSYALDGDTFYVNRTYRQYPLSQVKCSVAQDEDANYALVKAEGTYTITHKLWEAGEYALAKFAYKDKMPPNNLIKLVEHCRKEIKYELEETGGRTREDGNEGSSMVTLSG